MIKGGVKTLADIQINQEVNTMKRTFAILLLSVSSLFITSIASAHCEIPCGIYDDKTRITLINEHITTIEKSMNKITELEKGDNKNQLIRWVLNKEEHADKLQEIVTQYFMTQRIKADTPDYDKKLSALHKMLVYSMKCKQTTDLANVELLKNETMTFHDLYFHD